MDWNDCDCVSDNDEVKELNDNVMNNESSLLTYIIYHCLVIRNLFRIILDAVPTNMACSTLCLTHLGYSAECNAQCVMFLGSDHTPFYLTYLCSSSPCGT